MFQDFGWGHGFAYFFSQLAGAMVMVLVVAVTAGLIFLLARFLLVATRAAQLYVAQHEPARATAVPPVNPAAPTPAAAPDAQPTQPEATATTTTATAKAAATKPRTKKIPPVV